MLASVTPETHPGLLGICLSGAGPTILALATGGFEAIALAAQAVFERAGVVVKWQVLEVGAGSSVKRE